MNAQLSISFDSPSPINKVKLTRQNKIIFEYLEKGNSITTMSARNLFQVYNLHSRISDLRNRGGIIIYDRTKNFNGTICKEYSLTPFI